jgi:hypothetical protein
MFYLIAIMFHSFQPVLVVVYLEAMFKSPNEYELKRYFLRKVEKKAKV